MPSIEKKHSLTKRLVLSYGEGSVPAELMLDTPEKVQAFRERMVAATQEALKRDRRAALQSLERGAVAAGGLRGLRTERNLDMREGSGHHGRGCLWRRPLDDYHD